MRHIVSATLRTALAAIVLLPLLVAQTGRAHADEPRATAPPKLTVERPEAGSTPNTYTLSATLADAAGQPIAGERVEFFLVVDVLGVERLTLGSSVTDATGHARLRYRPTRDGAHVIGAALAGRPASEVVAAPVTLEVQGVGVYVTESLRLQPLLDRLPAIVVILALTVWALLAFIAGRTLLTIVRAGRRAAADREALRVPRYRIGTAGTGEDGRDTVARDQW